MIPDGQASGNDSSSILFPCENWWSACQAVDIYQPLVGFRALVTSKVSKCSCTLLHGLLLISGNSVEPVGIKICGTRRHFQKIFYRTYWRKRQSFLVKKNRIRRPRLLNFRWSFFFTVEKFPEKLCQKEPFSELCSQTKKTSGSGKLREAAKACFSATHPSNCSLRKIIWALWTFWRRCWPGLSSGKLQGPRPTARYGLKSHRRSESKTSLAWSVIHLYVRNFTCLCHRPVNLLQAKRPKYPFFWLPRNNLRSKCRSLHTVSS